MDDEMISILVGATLLVVTVFALIAAGTVVFFAAIPAGIGYAIYWTNVKSPQALERKARETTHSLYRSVRRKFTAIDIPTFVEKRLGREDEEDPNVALQYDIAMGMVELEGLDAYPPEPPELCNTIEGGKYRDFLNQVSPDDFEARLEHICSVATLTANPPTPDNVANLIYTAVERFDDGRTILPKLEKKIDVNYAALGSIPPRKYEGDDIIDAYLKNTPLELMREMHHEDSVEIPDKLRNEHHMIIGGTGHGKTQCLQQMLLGDLDDPSTCVIVLDSQGGMLERLLHVVSWDRIMYLDAGNVHAPLALSAFEIGSTLRPEDEPKVRMAIALFEHMFSSRETKLTTKQQTLYRYLTRFLFEIPDANFDTALEILEHGYEGFAEVLPRLPETVRSFVENNLDNPKAKGVSQGFKQTRQEVAQRIYTLLESTTIRAMFNSPENKVDLGKAIRDNRIILINSAQDTLGVEGASLFGRYCLAHIGMEILSRPETTDRVYFYIDEAQEYLSGEPIIHRLFEQGRKRGLCMICAFHRLGQLGEELSDMMRSLTSIKFAGGISAADASKLAKELQTDSETILEQPKLSFWAAFKGAGSGVYRVEPGLLEQKIADEPEDIAALKEMMLREFHYQPQDDEPEPTEAEDPDVTDGEEVDADLSEEDYKDYWADDWEAEPPEPGIKEDNQKKSGPKDTDPDAPQDLD